MSKVLRRIIVVVFFVWLIGLTFQKMVWPIIPHTFNQVMEMASSPGEIQRRVEGTLPTEGVSGLQLRSVNGKVQLEPAEGKELRYEAIIWAKGSDAQRKVDQAGVRVDRDGTNLIMESKHPGTSVSNEGINYVVYIPRELSVQINLTNGSINGSLVIVKDRQYSFDLVNGGVGLDLRLIDGFELTASAVNGDFKVQEAEGVIKNSLSSSRGHLSAVYGGGGAKISIHTVNGAGTIQVSPYKQ